MKKFTKKQIEKIEKETYFTVADEGDFYSFYWYTDAGEDFSFSIEKDEQQRMADSIVDYANDFDAEEHATMWYGANRGEPKSIRTLLNDADAIKDQLENLATLVSYGLEI